MLLAHELDYNIMLMYHNGMSLNIRDALISSNSRDLDYATRTSSHDGRGIGCGTICEVTFDVSGARSKFRFILPAQSH